MSGWLNGVPKQDFHTSGGEWTRQPAIILIHSTEGLDHSWPGYNGGKDAPHFTHDPLAKTERQHISMDEAARALKNADGGVQTNREGCIQIEVIGTCDPKNKGKANWTYLPDLADWSGLGSLIARIAADRKIALTSTVRWAAYPGSYGTGASQRLSGSSWERYTGLLGHQHAPENDHGDPGDIDIAAILAAATGHDPTGGDVTNYVRVMNKKGATLKAGQWTDVNWDTESVDPNARVGGVELWLADRIYNMTFAATFVVSGSSDTIRTRTVEVDSAKKVAATDPTQEHQITSGNTSLVDTRVGKGGSGRSIRWQVYSPVDAQLGQADLTIAYWD